jgi:hypothetical protein
MVVSLLRVLAGGESLALSSIPVLFLFWGMMKKTVEGTYKNVMKIRRGGREGGCEKSNQIDEKFGSGKEKNNHKKKKITTNTMSFSVLHFIL